MMNFTPPKELTLRGYQADAIEALRSGIRSGVTRQILCAGTGAGKTVCAAHLLREADRKGSYALFLVDRVALVNQTSQTLDDYGIRHGIVQGINERWAPFENVQVCSVQTLARRSLPRDPDLIIYDECHCQYKHTLEYMARYPRAIKIGLTATPFASGMGKHWDGMVNVRSSRLLITDGHLIEPTIYVAKSPDDAELGVNKLGEFSDRSASDAGIKIVGDVVAEWIKKSHEHFGGPAKTIVFSPTVAHGRELCDAFAAAGYNFQQVSYEDKSDEERASKIDEFKKPESLIHGLVSCGVLTKGFDVPDTLIGISCKPYRKSLSSHIQEIGRVMRSHPGKSKALWLDHSGNIERFALDMFDVWEHGAGDLSHAEKRDTIARKREAQTREQVVCRECGGVMRGPLCMACGWERPVRSGIVAVDGEMRAFDLGGMAIEARPGLRAECLKRPRSVWDAAVNYCIEHSRGQDSEKARKWAYGVWRGIYPNHKLPAGWFGAPPRTPQDDANALVDREVRRFRKSSKGRAA